MKGSQEGQHRKNVFFCNFCIVQEYLGKIVSLQIHIQKKEEREHEIRDKWNFKNKSLHYSIFLPSIPLLN